MMTRIAHMPADVVARWKRQYCRRDGRWESLWRGAAASIEHRETSTEAIYDALIALGDSATKEQVDAAIGNDRWTTDICQECCKRVPELIQLGEELDIESRTVTVCLPCAVKYADFIIGVHR